MSGHRSDCHRNLSVVLAKPWSLSTALGQSYSVVNELEASFSLRQISKSHIYIAISKDVICSHRAFFHAHFCTLVSDWKKNKKEKFDKAVEYDMVAEQLPYRAWARINREKKSDF